MVVTIQVVPTIWNFACNNIKMAKEPITLKSGYLWRWCIWKNSLG
ncbi:UNVERIFIED_CONTAM: hypothetical protein GTU68_017106 [Idotea baltica]|nr:hypothetical protein [Idotea baltica]